MCWCWQWNYGAQHQHPKQLQDTMDHLPLCFGRRGRGVCPNMIHVAWQWVMASAWHTHIECETVKFNAQPAYMCVCFLCLLEKAHETLVVQWMGNGSSVCFVETTVSCVSVLVEVVALMFVAVAAVNSTNIPVAWCSITTGSRIWIQERAAGEPRTGGLLWHRRKIVHTAWFEQHPQGKKVLLKWQSAKALLASTCKHKSPYSFCSRFVAIFA